MTSNMFIQYKYDVTGLLKGTENNISLKFVSPTLTAKNSSILYQDTYGYLVPPKGPPEVQHGRDHVNFIRKEQCSFSWVSF